MVFVLMAVLLVFKAGAQNTYDFEVDGLGYTLIPPSSQNSFWTAAVSVITEEKIDIVVPNQVTYNEQTLDVVKIEILHTPTSSVFTENKQNVRSILIPSSVNSAWLEDFPKLTSITPNDGLQELVLKNITSLLQLVVPNSIMRIGVSSCSSLHKLVVLDGIEELRWVNGSSVQAGPFNSPIDTLYCGRNMDMSETGFPNGFCFNLKSLR